MDQGKVGKVSRLVLFPVKSMLGIDVQEVTCTFNGLEQGQIRDRHWVVVSEAGVTITARQKPRMLLIQPSFHGKYLHLDAEGQKTLKVPVDIKANKKGTDVKTFKLNDEKPLGVDCGKKAGQWLSKFLVKDGLRLVYAAPGLKKRPLQDRQYYGHTVKSEDQITHQEKLPAMMLGEASVRDLNTRLGADKQVTVDMFRPNIVIGDEEMPFAEEGWSDISIGECGFSLEMLCPRCIMTTIYPDKGKVDPEKEPLRALREYRLLGPQYGQSPIFGVYLLTQRPGKIRVGDPITAAQMTHL